VSPITGREGISSSLGVGLIEGFSVCVEGGGQRWWRRRTLLKDATTQARVARFNFFQARSRNLNIFGKAKNKKKGLSQKKRVSPISHSDLQLGPGQDPSQHEKLASFISSVIIYVFCSGLSARLSTF